jgi:hypothetical protein
LAVTLTRSRLPIFDMHNVDFVQDSHVAVLRYTADTLLRMGRASSRNDRS